MRNVLEAASRVVGNAKIVCKWVELPRNHLFKRQADRDGQYVGGRDSKFPGKGGGVWGHHRGRGGMHRVR